MVSVELTFFLRILQAVQAMDAFRFPMDGEDWLANCLPVPPPPSLFVTPREYLGGRGSGCRPLILNVSTIGEERPFTKIETNISVCYASARESNLHARPQVSLALWLRDLKPS